MSLKNKFSKVNTTVDEDIQKLRNDIDRLRWNPDFRKKALEVWDKRLEDQFNDYSTTELCAIFSSYQSEKLQYDVVTNNMCIAWVCTFCLTFIVAILMFLALLFGFEDNYNILNILFTVMSVSYLVLVPLSVYTYKFYPNDMKYVLVGRCLSTRLGSVKSMRIMSMKDQDYFERYLVNYTVDEIKAGREIIDV